MELFGHQPFGISVMTNWIENNRATADDDYMTNVLTVVFFIDTA